MPFVWLGRDVEVLGTNSQVVIRVENIRVFGLYDEKERGYNGAGDSSHGRRVGWSETMPG